VKTVCPSCGGVLESLPGTLVGILMIPAQFILGRSTTYTTLQPRTVVACTACEYAEVKQ
jgi:hypothetical protein